MARRYKSAIPPLVALFSLASVGCDGLMQDIKEATATPEENKQAVAQRQAMEKAPPSEATIEQLRAIVQNFLTEHHPEVSVQGFDFTQMTPNLYLIGARVTKHADGYGYVAHLTAERMRSMQADEDGDVVLDGNFLWVIDYATEPKMAELAKRHGFADEVSRVRQSSYQDNTWGQRTWFDDYLLWHFLFSRPTTVGYYYGSGFRSYSPGYRYVNPDRPYDDDASYRYRSVAAPTGGRSVAFINGRGWTPPASNSVQGLTGQPYAVSPGRGGGVIAKGTMGSVSRGGFGASGRASGASGVSAGRAGVSAGHASGGS